MKNKRPRNLTEQPGFYLGPFGKGKQCEEKRCRERAFSSTDDNFVRCYEHTLAYIQECAAKAVTTPKEAFDALTKVIKKLRPMR